MSASHHYWVIDDTDAAIGAAMRAAGPGIVPGGLATGQGASGLLALVKVRSDAVGAAPAGVTEMGLAEWAGTPATETTPAVPGYSQGPAWVRHEPQEWTGTENAVLVPVSEGTAEHVAHLPAGWAACEYHDGSRLVRYTGDTPEYLLSYTQLSAAEVTALAATEVR